MGLGGLEPPTSSLSGMRSSHLSYRPRRLLPYTWWSWSGSNRRPPECKSGALPAELQPQEKSNRGQLDAGTNETSSSAASEKLRYSQVEMPGRAHQLRRSSAGGLEWNGCFLLWPCVHSTGSFSETPPTVSLRKEVIQPQVLLRLPCYDFTPIMNHTLGRCPPCGSARRLLVQSTFVM